MRYRVRLSGMVNFVATLLAVVLMVGGNYLHVYATARQDEAIVTDQERTELQAFAKQFVARLLKTRDIRPLIPEFFLRNFTAIPKQDFYEKVSPELYAKLTRQERVRLFVAQETLGYFVSLDVMTTSDSQPINAPAFQHLLPAAVARKLNQSKLLEGDAKFTSRKELLKELIWLERAIREAQPHLKKKNVEQSAQFLEKLRKFERDTYIGYRVRSSLVDEEAIRELNLTRFKVGQKVFSVETPILIQLIIVKDAGKLRVLTLIPADGD